jgi:hypothetical protein
VTSCGHLKISNRGLGWSLFGNKFHNLSPCKYLVARLGLKVCYVFPKKDGGPISRKNMIRRKNDHFDIVKDHQSHSSCSRFTWQLGTHSARQAGGGVTFGAMRRKSPNINNLLLMYNALHTKKRDFLVTNTET